jgi:L-asparaginase II
MALLAGASRSGVIESVHAGAVVVLAADGSIAAHAGDPEMLIYPRSCNKPFQAIAMLEAGLVLEPELLAIACASHTGTRRHVATVQEILARFDIAEDLLGNTPDHPLDSEAAAAVIRAGQGPRPVSMNCSGKHAAMLATCVVNGWSTDGYLDADHPLQRHITAVLARLVAEPIDHIGVDGCGAPAHRCSLLGLARATRAMATGDCGPTGRTVATAMTTFPDLVGGPTLDVTHFMTRLPGVVVKDGAEGVMIAGLPDGRAVGVKVADGSSRPRAVLLAAGLAAAGVNVQELRDLWTVPILGHGAPVGWVQPLGLAAEWLGEGAAGSDG